MNNVRSKGEIQQFLRANRHAWMFATKASGDYLLARLGISNALWSGLEMATQATEKLLKSFLLFADNSLQGDANAVRKAVSSESRNLGRDYEVGHDVEACLSLAAKSGFPTNKNLEMKIKRINDYYTLRYPDNELSPTSFGSDEINDVDAVIFEVWDAFEKFDEDYFYVSGIMTPVYSFITSQYSTNRLTEITKFNFQIMTDRNDSFNSRRLLTSATLIELV